MKILIIATVTCLSFILTSCGSESCSCHTFSSKDRHPTKHSPTSVSAEKQNTNQQ